MFVILVLTLHPLLTFSQSNTGIRGPAGGQAHRHVPGACCREPLRIFAVHVLQRPHQALYDRSGSFWKLCGELCDDSNEIIFFCSFLISIFTHTLFFFLFP